MHLQDFGQRSSNVCSHHRAGIHAWLPTELDRLHPTIATRKKVQVHRRGMGSLGEVCLEADPFRAWLV
jgi:hypothetical protein